MGAAMAWVEAALAYARTIVDVVQQPLAVIDHDLRVRHANPAFQRLIPIVIGERIDASLTIPALGEGLASVLAHGTMPQLEVAYGERQLLLDARRVQAPPGGLDAILVALDDITEQRATEHALHHHMYLLEAITDTVFSLDTSWRILTWNPAAERFLGYTAAEAIGKRTDEVLTIEVISDREEARNRLAAGKAVTNEGRLRRKDGVWVEMKASTTPVRDREGKLIGFVCIMHDIRETKQLVNKLREHARVVEEANRELDSFTYSVSHDLRAPLRAIDGFSRILVEEHGDRMTPDESRLVEVIRRNTLQMGQLIDDLLAFARLGRKELAMSNIDMKNLLIELVPEVLAGTEDRKIDLRAGALPCITGDRSLLKQVWLNLLSNAVKYTRKRENAVITISAESTEHETVYIVEDNGAGFSMDYIDKLFGVFQRLHRNNEFEGTGVGLALVQRIVRRHGGRVWAEGKEDVGAKFYFALPHRGARNG
jgi:PAS domain S-box-containing protein